MNRKKVLILSLTTSVAMLLIILLSRKSSFNDTDIAGGPCGYEYTYYPIIIKDIIAFGSDSYDLELYNFAFRNEDTLMYYHALNNYYLEKNKLGNLKIGDTITLVESNIVSGSCTPHILSIDIKKYEEPVTTPTEDSDTQ